MRIRSTLASSKNDKFLTSPVRTTGAGLMIDDGRLTIGDGGWAMDD